MVAVSEYAPENHYYIQNSSENFIPDKVIIMSINLDGFDAALHGKEVLIKIDNNHRLLVLGGNLPWGKMLSLILPDLKRTEKKCWWLGRPLRVRIHLGIYLLQQLFNLTDRAMEQHLSDNAVFKLFCALWTFKEVACARPC